jgi:iron complex transport system ATP-binding protein
VSKGLGNDGKGLELDGVGLSLGGRQVVRDVSLKVAPGEVVGLLGRNGVGKTTLVRIASGAVVPERGEVRLDGSRLCDMPRRDVARRLAVVPQDTHVPFPFRVSELVLMGRAPHQPLFGLESASDIARARDAMRRMGIEALAERSIFELSGGERQLVVIARALAQEPDLLLLDEPTAFLDLRHRIDVMQVVRALAAEGRGALVVSHDIALAARACDRLVLLADGVVAAAGPPAEVLTRERLQEVFDIEADVILGPDDLPVVVPGLRGTR